MASDIHIALGPGGVSDYQKLRVNSLGELITTASGTFSYKAPTGPTKVTGATIGTSASNPLSGLVLSGRVSLSLRNNGPGVVYYKEDSGVTADDNDVTGGWDINPGENFNIDLDDSNDFYLISTQANTKVKFLQIAST